MKSTKCASPSCTLYAAPGHKYCWSCQRLGRDQERKPKENLYKFKSQIELFKYCWEARKHQCFVTGQDLDGFKNGPLYLSMFAHVLRKSAYGKWRLNPNNIVLLSPHFKDYSVHRIFDDGTYEEVRKFERKTKCSFRKLFELERFFHSEYNRIYEVYTPERFIVSKYLD